MRLLKGLLVLGGALVCSFVSPALSYAGGCGRSCYTPSYYTPPVVVKEVITPVATPVYVPVIVPAFSFQYAPPCAAAPVAVAPVGYAPVAPVAAVQPAASYQPGGTGYAQQMPVQAPPQQPRQVPPTNLGVSSQDKIRELAKALLEEMQRQAEQGNGGDDGPPEVPGLGPSRPVAPPQQPVRPPQQPVQPPPAGNPSAGGPNPQSPFASRAMAALSRTCAACHTGPASEGDAVIFLQPDVLNPNAPWRAMEDQIKKGLMPKRYHSAQPSPQEREDMRNWLLGR